MGIINWFKKGKQGSFKEAENELQQYSHTGLSKQAASEPVQANPFQVIQETQEHGGGGCCGGGGHEMAQLQTTLKPKITKVTKDMIIANVIQTHPQAIEIMMKNGLHCFGCGGNVYESIENGAKGHGMTTAQVTKIVNDINKTIKSKEAPRKKGGKMKRKAGGKKK